MTDALVDPHLLLIGRPPLAEYLGFVTTQTLEGETADPAALASEWRCANDRVRELETVEAGIADEASIAAIDSDLDEAASEPATAVTMSEQEETR